MVIRSRRRLLLLLLLLLREDVLKEPISVVELVEVLSNLIKRAVVFLDDLSGLLKDRLIFIDVAFVLSLHVIDVG